VRGFMDRFFTGQSDEEKWAFEREKMVSTQIEARGVKIGEFSRP